jgi:adenosylmethionine-8-amino-7-oxononanoate aminotransferase
MATRSQLEQWDRDHVWHPFTPMQSYAEEPPLIVQRAEGFHLFDLDGRAYIDGVSSLWCNVHGHRVPVLDDAIRRQLDEVAHSTLLGLSNVPAVKLARKLVEVSPAGLDHVFFSDDGATAVEVALKMAFQYWRQRPEPKPNKTRYLALGGAYHGDTLGDVSLGDIAHFHSMFTPLLFSPLRAPSPNCYRCPLGLERSRCRIDCAEELAELVRRHHDELAAVIVEPLVQGAAGIVVAPEGYLRTVRDVTAQHDVLLIADEVAVGFGRTGTLFACEQEKVTPDFLCVAKGLTGGYLPLAATLTTAEVFRAFLGRPEEGRTFFHGHTFTGNPLGAAVALANLELIEKTNLLAAVREKAERLRGHLDKIGQLPSVGCVRQKGLMVGIELVADRAGKSRHNPALRMGHAVCRTARRHGAILRPLGDVVVMMPPLAIPPELLDQLADIVYLSLREVAEHGA